MASKPKEDHDAQDETHPRRDRFQAAPSRCSGLIGHPSGGRDPRDGGRVHWFVQHFEGVTATWKGGFAYLRRPPHHHLLLLLLLLLLTGRSTATIVQSLQICVKRELSLAGPATTYSPV